MNQVAIDVTVISVAAFADLASTHYALEKCQTCFEVNPLIRDPVTSVLVKAASVAAITKINHELRKRNKRKTAKFIRYAVVSIWMGLAINNMRLAHEYQSNGKNR
jgi:hypothetical protein